MSDILATCRLDTTEFPEVPGARIVWCAEGGLLPDGYTRILYRARRPRSYASMLMVAPD